MREIVLASLVALAGCGRGADIVGMYQTISDDKDSAGCGPGVPVQGTFFRIQRVDVFGTIGFTYEICVSADSASCLGLGLLSLTFDTPIQSGWSGEFFEANASGAGCVLRHHVSTATVQRDGRLRVEFRDFQGPTSGACTEQAARAQAASLPCDSDEVIVGARVP